jgi:hypothetical protein
MRDVFYTLLVVWIIWRIMNGVNSIRSKPSASRPNDTHTRKEGDTKIDYTPHAKKGNFDKGGEYTDFEEIK